MATTWAGATCPIQAVTAGMSRSSLPTSVLMKISSGKMANSK